MDEHLDLDDCMYAEDFYARRRQYIVIESDDGTDNQVMPIDTAAEIADARFALAEAGIDRASVYHGDPNDPDSYRDPVLVLSAAE